MTADRMSAGNVSYLEMNSACEPEVIFSWGSTPKSAVPRGHFPLRLTLQCMSLYAVYMPPHTNSHLYPKVVLAVVPAPASTLLRAGNKIDDLFDGAAVTLIGL